MSAHITLLPPFTASRVKFEAVTSRIHDVLSATAPFDVALDSTGTFGERVAFLRVTDGAPQTRDLRDALGAGGAGFHPHVTLASRTSAAAVAAAAEAFLGFHAGFPALTVALFGHGSAGWRIVSEGRMGDSRLGLPGPSRSPRDGSVPDS